MLVYIKPLSLFPKLHSDTMFGAITSAISEIFPEKTDEMIKSFEDNKPPFLLSSTFPYIISSKKRFYPKIITLSEIETNENLKKFKKIDYLEEEIFFNIINGNITENDILKDYDNYFDSKNLLMKEETDIIGFGKNITPHNSVNRLTNESEAIFYSEGEEFQNIGLYFFIEILDNSYEEILKSAIKFLKDRGFGKDISTGKGQFDYEIEDISFKDLNNSTGDKFTTLSRYIPTEDELEEIDRNSAYEIASKQGRASSGEIRKQVKFFKEGSTFKYTKEYNGRIIKTGKDKPAVEYGYAFPVKCNIGGKLQ